MVKEKLTARGIREDLGKALEFRIGNTIDWRFSFIVPFTIASVFFGILLDSVLIALALFSVAVYHTVRYVKDHKVHKSKKAALLAAVRQGDFSVSVVTLVRIAREMIYEPHSHRRSVHYGREVTLYYFDHKAPWRVPDVRVHYAWSAEHYISTKGLENTSVQGNEFYYVSLREHPDIAYIYPCKLFELEEELDV